MYLVGAEIFIFAVAFDLKSFPLEKLVINNFLSFMWWKKWYSKLLKTRVFTQKLTENQFPHASFGEKLFVLRRKVNFPGSFDAEMNVLVILSRELMFWTPKIDVLERGKIILADSSANGFSFNPRFRIQPHQNNSEQIYTN